MKKISELKAEAKEASKNRNRVFEYKMSFIQLDFLYSFLINSLKIKITIETTKENPIYKYNEFVMYNHGPPLPSFSDIITL